LIKESDKVALPPGWYATPISDVSRKRKLESNMW
jgi:hypothetical protein